MSGLLCLVGVGVLQYDVHLPVVVDEVDRLVLLEGPAQLLKDRIHPWQVQIKEVTVALVVRKVRQLLPLGLVIFGEQGAVVEVEKPLVGFQEVVVVVLDQVGVDAAEVEEQPFFFVDTCVVHALEKALAEEFFNEFGREEKSAADLFGI